MDIVDVHIAFDLLTPQFVFVKDTLGLSFLFSKPRYLESILGPHLYICLSTLLRFTSELASKNKPGMRVGVRERERSAFYGGTSSGDVLLP